MLHREVRIEAKRLQVRQMAARDAAELSELAEQFAARVVSRGIEISERQTIAAQVQSAMAQLRAAAAEERVRPVISDDLEVEPTKNAKLAASAAIIRPPFIIGLPVPPAEISPASVLELVAPSAEARPPPSSCLLYTSPSPRDS